MSLLYKANFLTKKEADALFAACEKLEFVRRPNPRNSAQFLKRGTITFQDANVGAGAAVIGDYHNTVVDMANAPEEIKELRSKLSKEQHQVVNYLSLNRYPDGTAGIGYHNHKEDLELNTPVLLVSVGAPRTFWIRKFKETTSVGTPAPHGSLIVMPPEMNLTHQHAVLPEPKVVGVRYSFNCKCLEIK
jgi:alkylated DNA repair dioxygenase AlkB